MMSITPPDPSVIRANLESAQANEKFTPSQMRSWNSVTRRKEDYGLDDASYLGARKLMAPQGSSNRRPSPFTAIPDATTRGEHFEAIRVFAEISPSSSGWGASYLTDDMPAGSDQPAEGFRYQNYALHPQEGHDPVGLSQVPTSTTNPQRPRTVAAGYDPQRKCLTVVFRDGTYYNYFEVDNRTWENFKRSYSPGKFIYTYLDQKPRGYADASDLPEYARESFYKIARTGQTIRKGVTGDQSYGSRRHKLAQKPRNPYRSGNLGGTGRARTKRASA